MSDYPPGEAIVEVWVLCWHLGPSSFARLVGPLL